MVTIRDEKDGGWSWIVVGASFFINFIMDGVRYSFGLLYIEFLNHFSDTKGAIGLIGGIMFGLLLIAAPLSGLLVNKFGCRLITMTGSCLVFLGFFCGCFATGVGTLYITLGVLGGAGFSMLFMTMYVAIIQRFDKYRSLAIGLAVSGSGLGGFAFSPIANGLIETYTWRGTLLVLSGILLNGCVCGAVMRPLQPESKGVRRELENTNTNTEHAGMLENETSDKACEEVFDENGQGLLRQTDKPICTDKQQMKDAETMGPFRRLVSFLLNTFKFSLLTNHLFLLFAVVEIFINISYMVPFMYVPNMAQGQIANITRTDLVWLGNAMSISNVVSRVPIGVLADLKVMSNVKLMGVLCVLAGVSCVAMPFCGSYGLLVTACVCYSASIVSAMVLIPVVLSILFGDDVIADSFGLSLFFGGVSGLVGTPLAGLLYDLTGTYVLTFIMAGVEFGLGGLVLFIMAIFRQRIVKEKQLDSC